MLKKIRKEKRKEVFPSLVPLSFPAALGLPVNLWLSYLSVAPISLDLLSYRSSSSQSGSDHWHSLELTVVEWRTSTIS